MTVMYHYYRYRAPYSEEMSSLIEALERAKNDVEYEQAYPVKIICEDGTILDNEEIMQRSGYYSDSGPVIDGSLSPVIEDPTRLLGN